MSQTFAVIHEALGYESIGKDFSAAVDRSGRLWCAWHSMPATGGDDVMVRSWDGVNTSAHQHVSAESGVNCNPVLVCGPRWTWVFWTARRGEWCVLGSRFENEVWHEEFHAAEQHEGEAGSLAPTAAIDGNGNLWLAYLRDSGEQTSVWARSFDGQWGQELRVSGDGLNFRPRIAAGPDGRCWIAWDRYANGNHVVMAAGWDGARWLPEQRVSQSHHRELIPDLTTDANGRPWIAWIRLEEVCDEGGVIDQKTSIQCASLVEGEWDIHENVALLYQGLLAREGAWGYLGRRRRPMIAPDQEGGIHLFYEIKETESQSTGKAVGYLLMRHWNGAAWSDEYEVCREDYGYQIARPGELPGNNLLIAARRGWEEGKSEIVARRVNLFNLKRAELSSPSEWDRWKPCMLPAPDTPHPRHAAEIRGRSYHLFWGDLHCHGFFSSDAEGELDELLLYARDRAQLDFCAIADNDNYINRPLTDSEWELTQKESARLSKPGKFVAFFAYEWTYMPNGEPNHRIVVYKDRGQRIFRHSDPSLGGIDGLTQRLAGHNVFLFAHHPKWELTDSDLERNVEVCSSWTICIDKADTVRRHLDAGRKFGFLGCSDTHRRVPGLGGALTGVYARDLSRDAIFEALMARRCYATTGSRIVIDFSIEGHPMGEEFETHKLPHVFVQVVGTAPLAAVEIIRNGEIIRTIGGRGERLTISFEDFQIPQGMNYYYVRVVQQGEGKQYPTNLAAAHGNMAWSSPIWVKKT